MKVSFSEVSLPKKGNAVFFIPGDLKLSTSLNKLDKDSKGKISSAIKASKFQAEFKDELLIHNIGKFENVLLIGCGDIKKFDDIAARKIGGAVFSSLKLKKITDVVFVLEDKIAKKTSELAFGLKLKDYDFNKYKSKTENFDLKVSFQSANKDAKSEFQKLEKIANGVYLARDLVSEPPNVLFPESYAKICKDDLSKLGVKVKILGEKQMQKLGMGALLGVGQGSIRESQLVVMEYIGNTKSKSYDLALVGKGVTFDTGGISLKPSGGMEDMKYDMGGSAAVVGAVKSIAGRKAKSNVVAVVGLVENMPGSNAQRPSDIVKTMSGQTVEVLNTDAEGRLVLADALTFVQEKYKVKKVVNLATLTGAVVVSLGSLYAGLFSNCDKLSKELLDASCKTDERLWRFPLDTEYDKLIDSDVADIRNISSGRGAGSITAAQFLQRFIKEDVSWAHLDIAGVAWDKQGSDITPKGAVGFGVRLLDKLIDAD